MERTVAAAYKIVPSLPSMLAHATFSDFPH